MKTKEPETEATPDTHFRLVILGDGSVRTIALLGSRWVLGRGVDCTVPLRDPTVSRRHVALERHGNCFRFQDLGGSNPILVDGRPINQGVFEVGQSMLIGLTRISLERRHRAALVIPETGGTVMLAREVIDDDAPSAEGLSLVAVARRVLERIEWTFADLGDLADVAEPLLDLALNLTGRRRGLIGRFTPQGGMQTLASLDALSIGKDMHLPEQVLAEARRIGRASLVSMQEQGRAVNRLVIPLGTGPDGVMVLEEAIPDAANGQELLRLGRTLGMVTWHRLQESTERLRLREEVQRMRFHGTAAHNALLTSTRLQPLRQQLRELANADRAVLLVGEDGTEREDLAQYLHVEGIRAKEALVSIHLTNLPEWRRDKELFGDGRTSPSAAVRASGGTLFLDDIDQLAPHQQERLVASLMALPERATDEQKARPRLIAATKCPPHTAPTMWSPVLAELFLSAQLAVPPLRSDARDVLALAELFLSNMGSTPDGSPRLLSERTKRLLVGYDWPGNVRELRQVLEGAASRAGNQQIAPRHLPEGLAESSETGGTVQILTLEEVEQKHIQDVLQRVGGNRARAAQMLGIAVSTLYEKLRRSSSET